MLTLERERERERDDEETRFAKKVDVVFITDAVEPAVELSALLLDIRGLVSLTLSLFIFYSSNTIV